MNRFWNCEIQTDTGFESFGDPLTVDINFTKDISGQSNHGRIEMYNVSPDFRRQVEVDRFLTQSPQDLKSAGTPYNSVLRKIVFGAGYDPNPPVIFIGNIVDAWSEKRGDTDVILDMTVVDGAYGTANSISQLSVEEPTTTFTVMHLMIGALKDIKMGHFSLLSNSKLARGYTSSQNKTAIDELKVLASGDPDKPETACNCFIDNQELNILGINEAFLEGQFKNPKLFDATNIIGSPKVSGDKITFTIIFDPTIRLGELIIVNTLYNVFIEGQFKVIGITHSGRFSRVAEARAYTEITLIRPIKGSFVPIFQ